MPQPLVSLADGRWGKATHISDGAGTWRQILDVTPLGGDSPYFPPPPPTATQLLGVYSGNAAGDDSEAVSYFGRLPDIASEYYQVSGIGHIVADQTPRIRRGVAVLVTLSLKSLKRPYEALAAGSSDADYSAAYSAITNFIAALKTLSEVDTTVPVYGNLECEPDVKMVKGDLTCTPTQCGIGMDVFLRRVARIDGAPLVKAGLWFGGSQKTMIRTMMDQITRTDWIGGDAYLNGTGTGDHSGAGALANTWLNKWVTWLRSETNYTRLGKPRLGAPEFGMSVTTQPHTDAEIAAYYTDIRDAMVAVDYDFALLFDRPRDADHEITDGNHPLAVAKFAASLAG